MKTKNKKTKTMRRLALAAALPLVRGVVEMMAEMLI